MIIFKCDICKKSYKNTNKMESMIFYKKRIDYCEDCETKVKELESKIKEEINFRNTEYDIRLKQFERNLLKNI